MPQPMDTPSPPTQPHVSGEEDANSATQFHATVGSSVPAMPADVTAELGETTGITPRKAAAAFIFLTVTLDMLALGMIAPVLPRLVAGFLGGSAVSTARMIGIFGTLFAAIQFVFSPVLGSLSDRYGRRPIVLLSNFGLGFDYVVMALAPTLPWLFLGRVVSAFTASSVPTAMAYMADVTPREKRAAAFGMLGGAFGIGFVLGPALGGILGNVNPRLPFWVAGTLSVLNGLYGTFVLPESLPKTLRSPFSWRRANPVGSLRMFKSAKGLLPLAGLLTLGYIAQQSLMNVYVLYADFRFGWTNRTVGLSLATVGIFSGLYGVALVKPTVAKFGELRSMIFGYLGGALGYAIFGFSSVGWVFWMGIPFMNLMSLTWPSAQSIMSRSVPPNEQGQLQGAINSLRGISGLIGPGLFTYIFSLSIGAHPLLKMPGSPFFLAGALLLLGVVLLLFRQQGESATQVNA